MLGTRAAIGDANDCEEIGQVITILDGRVDADIDVDVDVDVAG